MPKKVCYNFCLPRSRNSEKESAPKERWNELLQRNWSKLEQDDQQVSSPTRPIQVSTLCVCVCGMVMVMDGGCIVKWSSAQVIAGLKLVDKFSRAAYPASEKRIVAKMHALLSLSGDAYIEMITIKYRQKNKKKNAYKFSPANCPHTILSQVPFYIYTRTSVCGCVCVLHPVRTCCSFAFPATTTSTAFCGFSTIRQTLLTLCLKSDVWCLSRFVVVVDRCGCLDCPLHVSSSVTLDLFSQYPVIHPSCEGMHRTVYCSNFTKNYKTT